MKAMQGRLNEHHSCRNSMPMTFLLSIWMCTSSRYLSLRSSIRAESTARAAPSSAGTGTGRWAARIEAARKGGYFTAPNVVSQLHKMMIEDGYPQIDIQVMSPPLAGKDEAGD
jgi:hypothetical protein